MNGRRSILIADALALVFALFWWGDDLLRAIKAHSAPVSAMRSLPNALFAGIALTLCLLAAAVALLGLVQKRDAGFKGYRLLPIAAIVLLFADLFLMPSEHVPIASADQLAVSIQLFGKFARDKISDGRVPTDPVVLSTLAGQLGSPPYLVHGAPIEKYAVQVRRDCKGPVQEAPGAEVGTLLYCVASDARRAWVSAVALPAEANFGAPSVFTRGGVVQWVEVTSDES